MIANSHLVTEHFGYWPEFCDAHLEGFAFETSGTILFSLFYIASDINKKAHIHFRFTGVSDIDLSELRSENVIDEIKIENSSPIAVSIEAACGLWGSFYCENVEVTNVHVV